MQQRVVPRNYYFCLYSNWTVGGDLDLIDSHPQILMHRQIYCAFINNILFGTNFCLWGLALVLSEATFDQLVELPGVGPTRAQQFLQLREEAGGEVMGSCLCNIGGVDWKGLADSGKVLSRVRVQMWACWAGWEIRVFWNGAMYQKILRWKTGF